MKDKTTDELAKILWDYNNLHQVVKKADVIIALGSHDTRVAERGAELYLQKFAPKILFSGGFGRLTDGNWTKSEAEIFSDIAFKMGVPKKDVVIENKSTNTEENLRFSMDLLKRKNIFPSSVILVHKPYMERRQFATWEKLFPKIKAYITSPYISYEDYSSEKLYPKRGFMIFQEIPEIVSEAFDELVNRGFIEQLVKD
ncbi:MAG: hypothetical protein UR20_C0053G0006 [Candidatus Woesebacteria bacterium GW2011_GWE2_31_6]|nr:MAG: hypothetical protein UR20_C0053G0006 [Candidatus Woesebacteria bacterium GW2011_GWE2_31_6]